MEKKKTPVSTVVFYIIGIILLIVSLFMLWTAVNYTKTYLQSYDATFKDMWSNTVQYVIAQFLPYCGMGVICLGIGRAIYGSANAKATISAAEAKAADEAGEEAAKAVEEVPAAPLAEAGDLGQQLEELARRIDTNREVLSIKIEEKEKRDSFRIKELERKVDGFLDDVKYINEPLEELVYKQAAGVDDADLMTAADESAEAAEAAEEKAAVTAAEAPAETGEKTEQAEEEAAGPVPQIFRMAGAMTMPSMPAVKAADAVDAKVAESEPGLVPQIFTVARTMTMTSMPK